MDMKSLFKNIVVAIITYEATVLLRRTKPKIIAITGSVGKTSIKDSIYEVLKDRVQVRKSEKSYNSEIGVPLTILGLPNASLSILHWVKNIIDGAFTVFHPGKYPKVLILELGVDHPLDMEKFVKWITPDIVVLSRLPDVPVHVEFFDSPEEVTKEKIKLVHALRPDGVFVYNNDDPAIVKVVEGVRQHSIGYSRYSSSHFVVSGDTIDYTNGIASGCSFTLTHLNESVKISIEGSLGVQHGYNAAAAAAVGSLFEVTLQEVQKALSQYIPPPGRSRLIRGLKDTLIIDDSYNSSPAALEYALTNLNEIRGIKRKITILGDMMELGQFSVREHERIGRLIPRYTDILVTIGVRARGFSKGAREQGMDESKIIEFDDSYTAGRDLQMFIKPGDALLVKASQSIRAERCIEDLMAEPERAKELLARQDTFWTTE